LLSFVAQLAGAASRVSSISRTSKSTWRRVLCGCAVATVLAGSFPSVPSGQGDLTPPSLAAQSPAANATGVSTLVAVRAVFSEPIQSATLVMQLRNSANQIVASAVSYDGPSRTATLDPASELTGSQTFTVTVSDAQDAAGNVMTTATWAFTTGTTGFQDIVLPQTGLVDPTVIQFAADGKIFVAEKSGRIYAFDSLADTTPTLVIDLRTAVHNFWDRGMLGMALHPNYPSTPYIYVMYASGSTSTASKWEAGRFPGPFRRRPTRSRLAGTRSGPNGSRVSSTRCGSTTARSHRGRFRRGCRRRSAADRSAAGRWPKSADATPAPRVHGPQPRAGRPPAARRPGTD
jgi:hypothetical protein